MKHLMLMTWLFMAFIAKLSAQLPDGSIAPDFTLQDINGNTIHLYDYLDAGKTVIIDFFEVQCGPCWGYKETRSLANAYNAWGPPGSDELMVFEVEGIKSSVNQIKGLATPTLGDWTAGEPFPFIATCLPNTDKVVKDYSINFFPTIYMICKDRRIRLIGKADTAAIYARMKACPVAPADSLCLDLLKIDSIQPVICSNQVHPYLYFQNYGLKTITGVKISATMDHQPPVTMTWSGNLKTYETILLDGTIFSQIGDGSHTIRYLITELNGSVTGFKRDTISIRFSSIQSSVMIPYTQDFSEPVFPYDKWTIDNPYPEIPTFERADIGYVKALRIPFFNIPKEYLSALYLPAFSFSSVSMPRLTFDLACTHNNSVIRHAGYDLINICASTDCNKTINILCTISSIDYQSAPDDSTYFIPLENQWKPVSLSLPSLANKDSVLLVFITGPTEGNNMYLRNIQLSNAAGLEEETNRKNFSIYPVPAKDILYIDFLNNFRIAHIELYNQFGIKVIEKDHSGGTKVTLNLRDLSAGCYLLRISTAFETFTKKIIVQ